MYLAYILLIIYTTGVVNSGQNKLQCKDEAGNDVDWYVLYKVPKTSESSDPIIRKGLAYLYITSDTVANGWQLSKKEIGSKDSVPGKTLSSLYKDDLAPDILWILYNDQAPNKNQSTVRYGHTKGVLMTDNTRGFWLIHSVPNYPPVPKTGTENKSRKSKHSEHREAGDDDTNDDHNNDGNMNMDVDNDDIHNDVPDGEYAYPKSGQLYGQSFLCISMVSNQMNAVGLQLMYNQIMTYRYNLPEIMLNEYPSLVNASKHVRPKKAPYFHKEELVSAGGQEFISFAKSDKWQKELYDDLIAPELKSNLLAETWLNGRGKLPSECNGSKVQNVQSIVLNTANVDFKSSRDHSKWAVTQTNKKNRNWVCIGDINRANTQFNRGGGAVCVNLPQLWTNYRGSVNEVEPCPKKKKGFFGRIADSVFSWFS
ncbi:hypothetical protein G9C98_007714 [Cotesia typhae]|uniref:Plancitoxin-1 n=1 Tax=Cotesia typhae TaxID=2053667 RepID=A0A8J5V6Q6_9HYME|nr:hypothetical protein G9C98_007714 [Cotesia typhae]